MEIICPICYENFENNADNTPKILPICGHTFCLACLKGIYSSKSCLYCPFKCGSELAPIYTPPQDLHSNMYVLEILRKQQKMFECKNCRYNFDTDYRVPYFLKICEHTYCENCIETFISNVGNKNFICCPIDGASQSFVKYDDICVKNIVLLELLETLKMNFNGKKEHVATQELSTDVNTQPVSSEEKEYFNLNTWTSEEKNSNFSDKGIVDKNRLEYIVKNITDDNEQFKTFFNIMSTNLTDNTAEEDKNMLQKAEKELSNYLNSLVKFVEVIMQDIRSVKDSINPSQRIIKNREKAKILTSIKDCLTDDLTKTGASENVLDDLNKAKKMLFQNQRLENAHHKLKKFKLCKPTRTNLSNISWNMGHHFNAITLMNKIKLFENTLASVKERVQQSIFIESKEAEIFNDLKTNYEYKENPFNKNNKKRPNSDTKTLFIELVTE